MNTVRRHTVTGFGAWPEAKPTYRIQFSNAELGVELTSSYMRMTAAEKKKAGRPERVSRLFLCWYKWGDLGLERLALRARL